MQGKRNEGRYRQLEIIIPHLVWFCYRWVEWNFACWYRVVSCGTALIRNIWGFGCNWVYGECPCSWEDLHPLFQHVTDESECLYHSYELMWLQAFEDLEFHHLEAEAHSETEREELNLEISQLESSIEERKSRLRSLLKQQEDMITLVKVETEKLETQRQGLLQILNQVSLWIECQVYVYLVAVIAAV